MFSLGRAVSVCPADTSSSQKGSIMLCPPFLTSVPWSIALLMLLLLCPEKLLMSTEHSFVSHPFQHLGSTGFHPFLTFWPLLYSETCSLSLASLLYFLPCISFFHNAILLSFITSWLYPVVLTANLPLIIYPVPFLFPITFRRPRLVFITVS